jgi:hypothetical protein
MTLILYAIITTAILCFLFFYARYLLSKLLFFSENIENLREDLEEYEIHLKSLYEMELFHGDETIKAMIRHTTHIMKKIEDFEFFCSLINDENFEDEELALEEEEHGLEKENN